MTDKENLITLLSDSRPKAKESTIKMYTANLSKLKKLFDTDNWNRSEKAFEYVKNLAYIVIFLA